MTREAFELSERFQIPVLLRLVTRLAHSRSAVVTPAGEPERPIAKTDRAPELDPAAGQRPRPVAAARRGQPRAARLERELLLQPAGVERRRSRPGRRHHRHRRAATTGRTCPSSASRPRICTSAPIRCRWASCVDWRRASSGSWCSRRAIRILEERLRGILPTPVEVRGMLSGHLPKTGELTPETVGRALGLDEPDGRRPRRRAAAAPAAAAVPGLPAPRHLRRPGRGAARLPAVDRQRRHRLLHPGRAAALLGHRVVRLHGRRSRHGQGRLRRRPAAGGGGDRRQHVPALGHHAADRRRQRRHRHDPDHPRQRGRRHDRRPGHRPASRPASSRWSSASGSTPSTAGSSTPARARCRRSPTPSGRSSPTPACRW